MNIAILVIGGIIATVIVCGLVLGIIIVKHIFKNLNKDE